MRVRVKSDSANGREGGRNSRDQAPDATGIERFWARGPQGVMRVDFPHDK